MIENLEKYYGCVYITTNMINRKQYTGQSVYPKDVVDGKYKGSGNYISKAIKKYGYDNFKSEIIEYIEKDISLDEKEQQKILDDRETYWIEKNKTLTPNGYNLKLGGQRGGRHHEESKKKMSENHADVNGKKNPMYGKSNPNKNKGKELKSIQGKNHPLYGTERPESVRLTISKANKGKPSWNKGIPMVEEQKENLRQKNLGRKMSDDFKRKMSEITSGQNHPRYGKKNSEEMKLKASLTLKNKPLIKCPYCDLESRSSGCMKRHHFDNCKLKIN
jgi:group I intron endonuclease